VAVLMREPWRLFYQVEHLNPMHAGDTALDLR